jgi:hypothetical protein
MIVVIAFGYTIIIEYRFLSDRNHYLTRLTKDQKKQVIALIALIEKVRYSLDQWYLLEGVYQTAGYKSGSEEKSEIPWLRISCHLNNELYREFRKMLNRVENERQFESSLLMCRSLIPTVINDKLSYEVRIAAVNTLAGELNWENEGRIRLEEALGLSQHDLRELAAEITAIRLNEVNALARDSVEKSKAFQLFIASVQEQYWNRLDPPCKKESAVWNNWIATYIRYPKFGEFVELAWIDQIIPGELLKMAVHASATNDVELAKKILAYTNVSETARDEVNYLVGKLILIVERYHREVQPLPISSNS